MNSIQVPHLSQPSSPSSRGNLLQRLWNWWSTVTGPRNDAFKTDIFAQERLRRARLVSALLVLIAAKATPGRGNYGYSGDSPAGCSG